MHLDRLRVVSALPSDGGWRAELALDRSVSPPRPVLVARVPPAVVGDALALSMLARGVDLASRVQHPGLRRLLGTGEVEGDLVLVEAWREGETLRGVLDAGGPLTPALASRVAIDLAGALHAGHTLPAALDRPLCHGSVRAERVLLAEDGEVLLCGLGRPFAEDASPSDDLRSLARLLLESLPSTGGDGPGPLAAVLERVLEGEGYPSVAAFAEAMAAAVAPADAAAVAARAEASQPEGRPAWLGRRRALEEALAAEAEAVAAPVAVAVGVEAPTVPEASAPATGPQVTAAGSLAVPSPPDGAAGPPPARTPPPLPGATSTADAPTLGGPPAADVSFVEVARGSPPPGEATSAPRARPLDAWLDHPRAQLVVGAVLGLVGLLVGLALGRR